jgi:hypothetical protein
MMAYSLSTHTNTAATAAKTEGSKRYRKKRGEYITNTVIVM